MESHDSSESRGFESHPLRLIILMNRKILTISFLIITLTWIFFQVFYFEKETVVSFSNISFNVEIAESEKEKEKGLSGREFLNEKEGLLFSYNSEDYHGVWMKEMLFPIDVIWIDKDLIVVDIKENVYPETYPEIFYSEKPSMYILEINSGLVKKHEIEVSDKVKLN